MDYQGQLDFTLLCRLWRQHKGLFRMVSFKDGQHAMLNVDLRERKDAGENGDTHYMAAHCKKSERRDGVNYYIGSRFKPNEWTGSNASGGSATESAMQATPDGDDLPF